MSGARRAERASATGARGRTNKIAGVLITAILFGSAARRCSWENRISCYQMTVRIEVLCAETLSFEYDRRSFSAGRDSLIQVCRLFAWIRGTLERSGTTSRVSRRLLRAVYGTASACTIIET